jgi:hypothetical protein
MDECGRHEDLCGLRQRNVIPYDHERTELYCSSLSCLSYFFLSAPCEKAHVRAFYSSRSDSYIETQSPTCDSVVIEIIYNIYYPNG